MIEQGTEILENENVLHEGCNKYEADSANILASSGKTVRTSRGVKMEAHNTADIARMMK